ncbi:MAG: hypothetical protein KJZ75_11240 [Hyphomonadaceae bacterium]|nr:hypothetical protein [Hyphomonadaceae bacterium]
MARKPRSRRRRAEWGLGFDLHTAIADKVDLIMGAALLIGAIALPIILR